MGGSRCFFSRRGGPPRRVFFPHLATDSAAVQAVKPLNYLPVVLFYNVPRIGSLFIYLRYR
jgi:hypothetical protein